MHGALKIPPHITLKYPFDTTDIRPMAEAVQTFVKKLKPFPFILKNFNHFDDRVWYVDVKPTPKLQTIQNKLIKLVYKALSLTPGPHDQYRTPHVTLAYKDLTPEKFHKVETFLTDKTLQEKVIFNNITILKFANNKWQIYKKFRLN